MGAVFQYVADHALDPCGDETCHHCGRTGPPIYRYTGEIVNPVSAADPQLAADDLVVYELCVDCIRGGNVRKSDYRIGEMLPIINRFAADRARAVAEYHQLPDIPLFLQRDDWPMCCGGWCEFVGCPATYDESRQVPSGCHRAS